MPDTTENRRLHQTFARLPLGAVTPRGWLRRQLEIQADGLTGHLDEFWPDLADNQWLGGTRGGWERAPYYADGLVPLAYLLDEDNLKRKAERWAEGFLDNQHEDGWLGPEQQASHQGYERDPWPRFVVLKVLRQYAEVTNRSDVVDAMVEFCRSLQTTLDEHPLDGWAEFRWQDFVVSAHWLYERTGEDWLLELATTAAEQGFDWSDHFADVTRFDYADPAPEWSLDSHVVNHAMGVKAPGVLYRQSGDEADRRTVERALDILDRYHGQANGLFTGDECLGGRDPTRGTELCAVVEFTYSLEQLVATFGDARFADRLERVAYNALPATFTPDMWAHQYDQQANQVLCNVASREWTNGPDANVFGLEPNFGCCTANMHQGWPKFASSLWMRADDGLAAVAYAPCDVETEVGDVPVRVAQETAYPFEDEVRTTVSPDEPTWFAIHFRVPEWASDATVQLPDGEVSRPDAGSFHRVEREWKTGDEVRLSFSPRVDAQRRYQGSVAVRRGPLTLSLPMSADEREIHNEGTEYADREFHPAGPWNYALALDAESPADDVEVRVGAPGEVPFSPDDPPVTATVEGRRVPDWELEGNDAGPVPRSPVPSEEPAETLTLVPYGATNLRVTEFPLLEAQGE